MIVVMPHLQPVLFSGRGDRPAPVEEFLGRELPEYIDSHYRTVTDRRGRAIAGISMGGYGATLLGDQAAGRVRRRWRDQRSALNRRPATRHQRAGRDALARRGAVFLYRVWS